MRVASHCGRAISHGLAFYTTQVSKNLAQSINKRELHPLALPVHFGSELYHLSPLQAPWGRDRVFLCGFVQEQMHSKAQIC